MRNPQRRNHSQCQNPFRARPKGYPENRRNHRVPMARLLHSNPRLLLGLNKQDQARLRIRLTVLHARTPRPLLPHHNQPLRNRASSSGSSNPHLVLLIPQFLPALSNRQLLPPLPNNLYLPRISHKLLKPNNLSHPLPSPVLPSRQPRQPRRQCQLAIRAFHIPRALSFRPFLRPGPPALDFLSTRQVLPHLGREPHA